MPRIYKQGSDSITVLGKSYTADANGIIDIPDAGFSDSVYSLGWVSAKGREAALARAQEQAVIDTPVTALADSAPAALKNTAAASPASTASKA